MKFVLDCTFYILYIYISIVDITLLLCTKRSPWHGSVLTVS